MRWLVFVDYTAVRYSLRFFVVVAVESIQQQAVQESQRQKVGAGWLNFTQPYTYTYISVVFTTFMNPLN